MICTVLAMILTTMTMNTTQARSTETVCIEDQRAGHTLLQTRKAMVEELSLRDQQPRKVTAEVYKVLPDGTWHKLYDLE